MKVAVYHPGDIGRSSGTPNRARNLAEALSLIGVRITVVAYGPGDIESSGRRFVKIDAGLSLWKRTRILREVLRSDGIDVLFGQTHNSLSASVAAARLSCVPCVVDLHSARLAELESNNPGRTLHLRARAQARLLIPMTAAATTVSFPLKDYYSRLKREITVVPGGVDLKLFNPSVTPSPEIQGLRSKSGCRIIVGYAGNLRPYQGVQELADAALRLASRDEGIHFVFIGDGPLRQTLVSKVRQSGAEEWVHFLPQRPYREVPPLLAACDVLVIPRPSNDITELAFPSKLPEYMAMGKTVISTDVGDAARHIRDGQTGVLVPPHDTEALEAAILGQKEDGRRGEMGKRAFEAARREMTWRARAETLLELFHKVAG